MSHHLLLRAPGSCFQTATFQVLLIHTPTAPAPRMSGEPCVYRNEPRAARCSVDAGCFSRTGSVRNVSPTRSELPKFEVYAVWEEPRQQFCKATLESPNVLFSCVPGTLSFRVVKAFINGPVSQLSASAQGENPEDPPKPNPIEPSKDVASLTISRQIHNEMFRHGCFSWLRSGSPRRLAQNECFIVGMKGSGCSNLDIET